MIDRARPVALITGANRGIGLATARALAERDYHVLIGSRELATGEAAVRQLRDDGRRCHGGAQPGAPQIGVRESGVGRERQWGALLPVLGFGRRVVLLLRDERPH